MSSEAIAKSGHQLVTLNKALKLAEAWVSNMTESPDNLQDAGLEGRASRLGLGAISTHRSNLHTTTDPVEKKLRAKLNVGKKQPAKNHEKATAIVAHTGDSEDDDMESRANVYSKKRQMVHGISLPTKKRK